MLQSAIDDTLNLAGLITAGSNVANLAAIPEVLRRSFIDFALGDPNGIGPEQCSGSRMRLRRFHDWLKELQAVKAEMLIGGFS